MVGAQHPPDLRGDRGEGLCRRGPLGDQRRNPAQRGLLVFAAPPLGDVAPHRVHETLGEYHAGAPLKPAHPAVGAQVAGLELAHVLTEFVRVESLQGARPVIGMNELDEGSRHELGVREPERSLEGLVDTGEVAVEVGDAEQVERELEEVAELPLGPLAPVFHVGEGRHGVVDAREQLRPGSLERRDVCAMSQTVVSHGGGHLSDLAGQALHRDVQVVERRRDVADLVTPAVTDVEGQLAAGKVARALGDLPQRDRDRPPQREPEAGDNEENGEQDAEVTEAVSSRRCRGRSKQPR